MSLFRAMLEIAFQSPLGRGISLQLAGKHETFPILVSIPSWSGHLLATTSTGCASRSTRPSPFQSPLGRGISLQHSASATVWIRRSRVSIPSWSGHLLATRCPDPPPQSLPGSCFNPLLVGASPCNAGQTSRPWFMRNQHVSIPSWSGHLLATGLRGNASTPRSPRRFNPLLVGASPCNPPGCP